MLGIEPGRGDARPPLGATPRNVGFAGKALNIVVSASELESRLGWTAEPNGLPTSTLESTSTGIDSLGAGENEIVLVVQGSSARLGAVSSNSPVDAVVIGIVDTVDLSKKTIDRAP